MSFFAPDTMISGRSQSDIAKKINPDVHHPARRLYNWIGGLPQHEGGGSPKGDLAFDPRREPGRPREIPDLGSGILLVVGI